AVRVDIAVANGNGPVAIIENMGHELGVRPVGSLVFQINDLAGVAPTKDANDQIKFADAAKVAGLHVGDAAHAVEKSEGCECAVGGTPEPDHAAAPAVRGLEAA